MQAKLLGVIADNPALFAELKEVLRGAFNINNPTDTDGVTNEVLGQVLRARLDGLKYLERGFKEIELYKTLPGGTITHNPAI